MPRCQCEPCKKRHVETIRRKREEEVRVIARIEYQKSHPPRIPFTMGEGHEGAHR